MTKPLSPSFDSAPSALPDHESVVARIAAAELLVASGETVDLAPLGERVATYCETLRAVPAEKRKAALERLGDLLRRMDDLTEAVENRLADVRRQLASEVSPRAASAYGRSDPESA